MTQQSRRHRRVDSRLSIELVVSKIGNSQDVAFRGVAHALDVSAAGMKLRIVGERGSLVTSSPEELHASLTVMLSPRESLQLKAGVKWARVENGQVLVGVEYEQAKPGDIKKLVAWSQHALTESPSRTTARNIALGVCGVLVLVQTVRLFSTEGTLEQKSVAALQKPIANGGGASRALHTTDTFSGLTAGTMPRPSLAPHTEKDFAGFMDEPRDEAWAKPVEGLFAGDFQRLLDKQDENRRRIWQTQLLGVECRTTKCVVHVSATGPGQFGAFYEQQVLSEGQLDPDDFAFRMRCRPTSLRGPLEGPLPSEVQNYSALIMFDCAKPVYGRMPNLPDISKDRLLNPALRDQLPPEIKQNLDKHLQAAQKLYAEQLNAYQTEEKRRNMTDFRRLEPSDMSN